MSILLADDDVHLATFLSKSLESEGYSVHTALDDESVRAELKRQNYKLIILDLNFGQTDGLKLLEKLRMDGSSTPVMVLSARNKVSDRIQALNLGADDYVTKPFSFQELAARVNALLGSGASPELVELVRNAARATNPRGFMQGVKLGLADGYSPPEVAAKVAVPVLMISGDEDQVNPVDTNAAVLQKAMPKARLEIIKGIGHLPQVEAPERVNALLREFLAQ